MFEDWDLWGPLLYAMVISTFICMSSSAIHEDEAFGAIMMTLIGGAVVISLNSYLVANISAFYLNLSIIGYCLFPLALAAVANFFIRRFIGFIGMSVICVLAWAWATVASNNFLAHSFPEAKAGMLTYPVCLFYIFIAAYVLLTV